MIALVLALALALCVALARRLELARMRRSVEGRTKVVRHGRTANVLHHPVVDLSRCLGCGTCVAACPEDGVLELVHGQAMVVQGARCVGHAACERECPSGAITVTISNLSTRTDIPVLSEGLEANGSPGLFLAGEITAHALIKSAIDQGAFVGRQVAARVAERPLVAARDPERVDLCIVGAGPAGLACSLEARQAGLKFLTIDQEAQIGGTVAKYPRRKLVVTQPVELPVHGKLKRTSYEKEELIELWEKIANENELPIHGGVEFRGVRRLEQGGFAVQTSQGVIESDYVCLAMGRRGTPRRLGVPGEDLPKVAYNLIDAHSYQSRRVLVVGGGDSAVETALGLAEQPGNEVTLSYRQENFFRLRARNEANLQAGIEAGKLRVLTKSQLLAVDPQSVDLEIREGATVRREKLANDEVFVMAGGVTPFQLLADSGVSFDPAQRQPSQALVEQGTGLVKALGLALALALLALAWAAWNHDYYSVSRELRPAMDKHQWLRPGRGLGLWLGIGSIALVLVNLAYLLRRSRWLGFRFGSLPAWMSSHIGTGILAFLSALLHSAMSPRNTVGGHALWLMAILLVTGAIGRYFYARVPRAANGRELELEDIKLKLHAQLEQWDKSNWKFVEVARAEIEKLIDSIQWQSSFLGRVTALLSGDRKLRAALRTIRTHGESHAIPRDDVEQTLVMARQAYSTALAASHLEDLRAILNTWRYLHRWLAVLMLVLIALHVVYALSYGGVLREGMGP